MLTAGDTVVIVMVLALMHLQSRAGGHSAGVRGLGLSRSLSLMKPNPVLDHKGAKPEDWPSSYQRLAFLK